MSSSPPAAAGVEPRAIVVVEHVAAGAEPEIAVPVEPILPPAPNRFSIPFPPSSSPSSHSPNHNFRGQNHKRNYHQGNIHHNRYSPRNPNPNISYTHRPPLHHPMWTPTGSQQWAHLPPMVPGSIPSPQPFPQNGQFRPFIDVNVHPSIYNNAMVSQSYTYPPIPIPYSPPPMLQTQYVKLMQDIRNQIEYYFSVENLETDRYLKSRMDKVFGWVALEVIAKFRRVAGLTDDLELIRRSLRSSEVVQLHDYNVRRRNDWQRWISQEHRKLPG